MQWGPRMREDDGIEDNIPSTVVLAHAGTPFSVAPRGRLAIRRRRQAPAVSSAALNVGLGRIAAVTLASSG